MLDYRIHFLSTDSWIDLEIWSRFFSKDIEGPSVYKLLTIANKK